MSYGVEWIPGVVLVGTVLVLLLARTLRRRLAERHQSTQRSVPIATAIAQADPS